MKATAIAPANIAFIKYWGKTDPQTRIPLNDSISMNLSGLYTVCTVEVGQNLTKDEIEFVGEKTVWPEELARIVEVLDRVRAMAKKNFFAKVKTQNNFPKATGIASSAAGFAALSLAALSAFNIKLSEKELSIFARQASGTACRSIPDGFVEWKRGTNTSDSYARQIFPPDYWQIGDVVVILTSEMKKVSSTAGHKLAETSPFCQVRLAGIDEKISRIKQLIREKNFSAFGQMIEDEALSMHAICLTSTPPVIYWEPTTIKVIKAVMDWREKGEVESYFTIDAGSSVHVICQNQDIQKVAKRLESIAGVQKVVINFPARGAALTKNHLF